MLNIMFKIQLVQWSMKNKHKLLFNLSIQNKLKSNEKEN